MPNYRHRPLSQRLGLSFNPSPCWRIDMPDAECFMYFIAALGQLFGKGHTLYIEGREVAADVAELYEKNADTNPSKLTALDRHPSTKRWHVAMGPALHKQMSLLATCKTYPEICDSLMVYKDGVVLMDGSRVGERVVLFDESLSEVSLRKFCRGKLRGELTSIA